MAVDLDRLNVDWSDIDTAGAATREVVKELARDRQALRKLILAVESQPELLARCERHLLLDYIVIYDALDRGFRLRVHLSTEFAKQRPHDHRFPFSTYIVRGSYSNKVLYMAKDLYALSDPERTKAWMSVRSPDQGSPLSLDDLVHTMTRIEGPGSCYTLDAKALHEVETQRNTVSVFLRGPAVRSRSIIMDRETSTFWWRFGHQNEPDDRRRDKTMTKEDYRAFVAKLEELDVI